MAGKEKTYAEIRDKLGVCNQTISDALGENGLKAKERKFEPLRKEIFKEFRKTKCVGKTAKALGMDYSKVRYHIKKHYKGKMK